MAWTESQQIALAIVPKISAILSLCGSSWIIIEVASDKHKRSNVYHRLLAAMSVYDVSAALWLSEISAMVLMRDHVMMSLLTTDALRRC